MQCTTQQLTSNTRGACLLLLQLRLNAQQLEEKRAAEAAVAEIEELLAAEEDDAQQGPLKEELQARQAQLDELIAGFEVSQDTWKLEWKD